MSDAKKLIEVGDDFLLDDIEDLPSYSVLPTGAYLVHLHNGIVRKDIGERKFFEVAMTVKDVMELSEKLSGEESPPKAGDIASTLFSSDTETGLGFYKEFVKPIAEKFSCRRIAEINKAAKGLDMVVSIKRIPKKSGDGYNMNIKKAFLV